MAPNPRIIIVGAGIAGLGLALMLERAGMHRYLILERRPAETRPLGSAMALSAIMLRCFEQMGLLQDIIPISKPCVGNVFLDEDLNYIANLSSIFIGQRYGYFNIIVSRPDLYNVLFKHVPNHKILFGKKVLFLNQTSEYAQVRCSDNSIFHADIVIGADGAYSGIRQSLYKSIQSAPKRNVAMLEKKPNVVSTVLKKVVTGGGGKRGGGGGGGTGHGGGGGIVGPGGEVHLPASDSQPLRFDQHAVVGMTKPLDPEKYPFLKDKSTQVTTIMTKNGFSAWLFPVTGNRICWALASRTFETPQEQAQAARGVAANFKVSEWGPEAVDHILNLDYVKNQKSPFGGTFQDLFDQTEKGTAVRIMLEDKAFKTWYYKRTVLVGDACHKTIPFAGIGALQAFLDCIILTNALYDMPDGDTFTPADITQAFQTYYAQRAANAAAAVKGSSQISDFVSNTSRFARFTRKATLAGIPDFMITITADRIFANRPILSFLPFVPDYGIRKSNPQPLGRRDRKELEMLRQQEKKLKKDEARKRMEDKKQRKAARGRNGCGTANIDSTKVRVVSTGPGAMLKTSASRILIAANVSSFSYGKSSPGSPSTMQTHSFMDQATPRHSLSVPTSSSTTSLDRFNRETMTRSDGAVAVTRAFASATATASSGDAVLHHGYYDVDENASTSDSASVFSFSSRYTLPYDAEELEREMRQYQPRDAAHQYYKVSSLSVPTHNGCEPDHTTRGGLHIAPHQQQDPPRHHSHREGDSTDSVVLRLWKRYQVNYRLGRAGSASLQSSTIGGHGHHRYPPHHHHQQQQQQILTDSESVPIIISESETDSKFVTPRSYVLSSLEQEENGRGGGVYGA